MTQEIRQVSAFEGYELWADTYDTALSPIMAMDARHALEILEPQPGELVLDAGCGTGRYLRRIIEAGAEAVGVDFSPAMLEVARTAHPDVTLALADLQTRLPFEDGTFDAVLCALVGDHVGELGAALSELRRVLRAGGRLVFTVHHPILATAGVEASFEREGVEYRLGSSPYGVQEYLDLVMDAGFDALAFAEYRGDQRLADDVAAAQMFVGVPMLLLLAATV